MDKTLNFGLFSGFDFLVVDLLHRLNFLRRFFTVMNNDKSSEVGNSGDGDFGKFACDWALESALDIAFDLALDIAFDLAFDLHFGFDIAGTDAFLHDLILLNIVRYNIQCK